MNDFLMMLIKVVVIMVIVLGAKYIIPYLTLMANNSKYKWIADMASIAVKAAEQTILGDKSGPERKAVVIKFLKQLLMSKKISISDEELDNIIEAAVYAMNLVKKV